MLGHYKLRLGDGTVLLVDLDGLNAWLSDGKAVVQAEGSSQWRPLREFLREEREAARRRSRQKLRAGEPLPLVYPKPREDVRSDPPPEPPDVPEEPRFAGRPPAVQALADDPAGAAPSPPTPWSPGEEVPVIPFKPLDDEAPVRAAVPPQDSPPPRSRGPEPSLQAFADDPVAPPSVNRPAPDDSLPPIRLKPLDDGPPARPAAPSFRASPSPGSLGAAPSLQALAEDPGAPASAWRSASDDALPPIRLKPLGDEAPEPPAAEPGAALVHRLLAAIGTFLSRCLEPLGRLERGQSLPPAHSQERDAPDLPGLRPREPRKAPPSVNDLPTLRLADADEPQEPADVYEGEDGESPFAVVWLWAQRVVLAMAVVAGGAFVALTRDTWFPEAARLGQRLFAEIDRRARTPDPAEAQGRALQAAVAQLPHLAPETIRLVLAGSPGGVLEPPEVFSLAAEAEEKGLPALSPGEAEELKALRRELVGALRPAERSRVREYERVRSHRATFPFEDRRVLELVARGARALSPTGLARLQELSGRAIARGLAPAADGVSSPGE
jgi:hypothetical protein